MTVGGWKSRTTVEDMDLSLRTYVNGWKAVYLSDTTCMNEVSSVSLVHATCIATILCHLKPMSAFEPRTHASLYIVPVRQCMCHCVVVQLPVAFDKLSHGNPWVCGGAVSSYQWLTT